ncbi:HWE histidine kinase domain-containing protein [Roseicella aquatilis]|uniref:histidine kinase n=1 Tax=Roseicella aquatilis TaxID=2527868 RepID=A0A4R4D567_9PROT|nr:HWE histidine kinase domain-containing protein [Roseicella aquatilis]TCZ51427.1 HAMP domain-containing protein [Roseicella aquatilis]
MKVTTAAPGIGDTDGTGAARPARRERAAAGPARHAPGLRAVLALSFGGLALLAALAASLTVGAVADRRLRADIGAEFAAAAERAADLLDRGLFERQRDLQVAAALRTMRDAAATPAERRAVLQRMQETYPDYALLFFISPGGRLVATSSGVLEGADVSRREYFLRGRQAPFVGDVHDALLLAPLLGRQDNPPRLVDIAAPVRDAGGRLIGVVAAHLFWEWAEGIERDVMAPVLARHPGAEALVLAQDGKVLLGPRRLRDANLATLAPGAAAALAQGESGSLLDAGGSHLVGFAPTRGHRDYAGLGWSVLVRDDAARAFAPARRLAREVLAWGALAMLLAAALGWWLAGIIARPLVRLCAAAEGLKQDPWAAVPQVGGPREVAALAAALAGSVAALRGQETVLRVGAARLRLATEGAGIGAWELDLGSGEWLRSPRHDAILGHAAPPDRWTCDDLLRQVPAEERAAVAQTLRAALAAGEDWRVECRILRAGDGMPRWIALRGAPVREPGSGAIRCQAGVIEDVTERKAGEQAQLLLMRELDHRVKNQFAVFDGLIRFTARAARDAADMAAALRGRVRALASAHDLVREAAGDGIARGLRPTTLRALLDAVLGAFGGDTGRIVLDGPEAQVGPTAAAALALALHELATNAARHGALAVPEGRVAVAWEVAAAVRLTWREAGGPPLRGAPERRGFGSALVQQSVEHQLGGRIALDWTDPAGLRAVLEVPAERLAR